MEISELNAIREKMHNELLNRAPTDENTIFVYVGVLSCGINEASLALFKGIGNAICDRCLVDVKVCFDNGFDGVKVVKGGSVGLFGYADAQDACKFVTENVA